MKEVSRQAVIRRVNRKLAPELEQLKIWRTGYSGYPAGSIYRIDHQRNAVLDANVDLEALARELGALHDGETIRDDEFSTWVVIEAA